MPKLGYYVQGDWNAQCDECGRGFKFSQLALRWDGAWVDSACWEIRQPQDFVRGIKDVQGVPIARPRGGVVSVVSWVHSNHSPARWIHSQAFNFTEAIWVH